MNKHFAIYIENGLVKKSFSGSVYVMPYNPKTNVILDSCWVANRWDYPQEQFEDCNDSEDVEYRLAQLVCEDIQQSNFSRLQSVNLGRCSHIAVNAGGFGSLHDHWGDCEVRHD